MSTDVLKFYSETDRLRKLNEALTDPEFFVERGYDLIETVPQDLLRLSFPVFSPLPFLPGFNKILDIGCGAGLDIFFIKKQFPDSNVVGLDLSFSLLEENKRFNNCSLVLADGLKLPFKENIFDCVIMNGFFNLVNDKETFLKEITKILKPLSYIFVSDIYIKKEIEIPDEGSLFNIKSALKVKDIFTLFQKMGFSYEKGRFNVSYTPEFGLYGILWRMG